MAVGGTLTFLIVFGFVVAVAALVVGSLALARQGSASEGSTGAAGPRGPAGSNAPSALNDVQQQVQVNDQQNFLLSNLYAQFASGTPPPAIPTGRTILFQNQTMATTLDVYLTQGYPSALPATIITGGSALAPGSSVTWPIPVIQGWNGNFTAFPHGSPWTYGATLAEFGLNQLWSGFTPPLRDTFDISTVPPGIGTLCNNGPHGFPPAFSCATISQQSGFSKQQSFGYNVGMQIVPPSTGSLPSQTVTCTQSNGDSTGSIGFPNDTAFPKQQTIQCLNAPQGNYTVNFLDPVLPLP